MEKSFYWYDFETFGINPRTLRPSQFAGIRTNLKFESNGKGEIFYCKPSPDQLPEPKACLLTKITPQHCNEHGIHETDFAKAIWDRLNEPGTISLGYNTLGFDDEVCRFLFWRNFRDPYSHQWKDGCTRWDLFPIVLAIYALRGECSWIRWPSWSELDPKKFPGVQDRPGYAFKLELLTKFNNLVHSKAHDALSDVEATIALAKLIATNEPKLWQWALEHRDKDYARYCVENGPTVWVSPRLGGVNHFLRVVQKICVKEGNPNEYIVWDLMHDPSELEGLTADEMTLRIKSKNAVLESMGLKRLPMYRLKINESPFVCDDLRVLRPQRAKEIGIDFDVIARNSQRLSEMGMIAGTVQDACKFTDEKVMDADEALYSGFPSQADKKVMTRILNLDGQTLADEIDKGHLNFESEALQTLLWRFMGRNYPQLMNDDMKTLWQTYLRAKLLSEDSPNNITKYFEELDTLMQSYVDQGDVPEDVDEVLNELYAWGEHLSENL